MSSTVKQVYIDDEQLGEGRNEALVLREDCILVPRFSKKYPLLVRLDLIAKSEARMPEVAFVTKEKSPELLSALNIAWRDLHELVTLLRHEHDLSKDNLTKVRAQRLLDVIIPKMNETAGVPQSKDVRDALLEADADVQRAQRRVYELACVVELLTGKLKAFEMAFSSVKKIMGDNAYNHAHNPNLSGGGSNAQVGLGDRPSTMSGVAAHPGFGSPRD
jgi:hypothetical protein